LVSFGFRICKLGTKNKNHIENKALGI